MDHKPRTFDIKAAKRERVPVLIGLIGPSGSGKTKSALRLATGIVKVAGGRIGVIDTEANRAKHYAPKPGEKANPPDTFDFDHLEFKAPFSPLDYLDAIKEMVSTGVTTVIVDSTSHEHEGPGGVLEWHENLAKELATKWKISFEKAQMSAWGEPKAARRRLLNEIVQMPINVILCFRAKEKLEIVSGKSPVALGWMPIAGDEFVYEMTANLLLPPNSGGVPRLLPSMEGEKMMAKLPVYFKAMVEAGKQIDEAMGEAMAKWAAGDAEAKPATEKKRDPAAGLATVLALGTWPDAEARIMAALGKNHVSELDESDVKALSILWRDVTKDRAAFDKFCPPIQDPGRSP
jgi:energy-coupling factor transporter ATP-binding protein EcfA2